MGVCQQLHVGPMHRLGERGGAQALPFRYPRHKERRTIMQITELHRQKKQTGETIVEVKTEKLLVRLIDTYGNKNTLDEIIYVMACRRLAERMA